MREGKVRAAACVACALALAGTVALEVRAGEAAAPAGAPAPGRPVLVVPKVARVPTVDGRLEPGEWDRAAAVTGFIGAQGPLAGRMVPYDSRVWLAHDGERLYVGVRVALAPGAAPSRNYRRRDDPVYMDSHQVELWLTPPVRGQVTAYQFIGNAYGAIYDAKHVPDLGNVVATWNGGWTFQNHFEVGQSWTAEISAPFSDFSAEPVSAKEPWGGMVGVAWPQRSWPYTAGWYKNVGTHALLVMGDDGTCARAEDLASLLDNRLAPEFGVVNGGATEEEFRVRVEAGGVAEEKTVRVAVGQAARVAFDARDLPAPAKDEKRAFRATVTGPGGRTLLAGEWPFAPIPPAERAQTPAEAKPWQLATRVNFAPLAMGLKLWADLLDYPRRDALRTVRFTVRGAGGGKVVARAEVAAFEHDAAETLLALPKDLAFGPYEVLTEFLDAGGKTVDERKDGFEHKDYRKEFLWLHSDRYGEKFTVPPNLAPVRVAQGALEVWGRQVRMDGALPAQITSQGRALLAAPVNFVAVVDGKPQPAKVVKRFALGARDDVRAAFSGRYEVAGLRLDLAGSIECDGMMLWDVRAEPRGSGKPPVLDRLYLSVPVRNEHARYYHSTAGGWSGAFGILAPDAPEGTLWTSDGLADFVPYVGLSDDDRGIEWFADNDHAWVLGSDAPCAALVRRGDATELQVNLVRAKGPARAFAARFGLIACPVKPLPKGWRNACLDNRRHGESTINLFYGSGHGGCFLDPHDTKKLAEALGVDLKGAGPDAVLDAMPAGSIPLDAERVKRVVGEKAAYDVGKNYEDPATVRDCYFFNAKMYFEGYRSAAFAAFFPGDWTLDPPSGWFHLTPVESYQDFFSFHMNLWMKHWIVPGFYFDEVYLDPDYNVFNGNGKVMADGRVRGTVPLLAQRRFLRRMQQLFLDHKRTPFLWVHTSNYMAPHAISAADVAMFGEDKAPTPFNDVPDTISPVLLRSIGRSQKFGFVPVWMNQAGRGSASGARASFFGRQCYGWCWMHDVSAECHTSPRGHALVAVRHAWGIEADDVAFLPYWDNAKVVRTDDPEFLVSAWTRPGGKVMLAVMNLHKDAKAEATITLDAKALGLQAAFRVFDVEQGPMLGEYTADMREADRLMAEDPAAHAARVAELNDRHRDVEKRVAWDPAKWQAIGTGPAFKVAVPPRDFVVLVVR